jgi:hypothetical protein
MVSLSQVLIGIGVVLVILTIITAAVYVSREHADNPTSASAAAIAATGPALVSLESAAPGGEGRNVPELASLTENQRYYSACNLPNDNYDCSLKCGDAISSTAPNGTYGMGLEYKDFAAAQALDPQVVKNHAEYTADRKRNPNTTNITGPTWSPDYHMSYDPIPWIGLRRPQNVPVCNPTQVPDVDTALYEDCSSLSWRSG